METFDFVVLGGGSAGFNAARVAASLGMRTAVIDGARRLGGLCILEGCMPSKTLLYSAEILHRAQQGRNFGLRIGRARADMPSIQARKTRIIGDFARHRAGQLKSGDFRLIRNQARFVDPHIVELAGGRKICGKQFLIATGSLPSVPDIPGLKEASAWTSEDVLHLDRLPRSVIVLGGGLVAVELAQFLARVGTRVTVVQRSRHLLKEHSAEAAAVIADSLAAGGVEILAGTELRRVSRGSDGFSVVVGQKGRTITRRAQFCLNALGRRPNTASLGLEAAGVEVDERGQIAIDRFQRTSVSHIYAAGDCSGPVEIVHIAVQQGELAARRAAGLRGLKPVDFDLILSVVFTDPQLATIGLQEKQLKKAKTPFLSASYPFDDHGKSILMGSLRGFVKVMAAPRDGRILGVEIVGPDAGELIHCFTGPMAMRATVFDLLRAPWYHPTLSEIVTYPLDEIAERIRRR